MASMAAIDALRLPSTSSSYASSTSSSCKSLAPRSLSFSASALSGDKVVSKTVIVSRQMQRTPLIVSPKAVSDSKNSQTCLDPDASRVSSLTVSDISESFV